MNRMVRMPPALPASVAFSGGRGEFRALVTRGALLELVTVGFYRFWLTTDIRRHLWSDTAGGGDPSPKNRPRQGLFIGLLFASCVHLPACSAHFLCSALCPPSHDCP